MAASPYYYVVYYNSVVVSNDCTLYSASFIIGQSHYEPGDEMQISYSGDRIITQVRTVEPRPNVYIYYNNAYYFVVGSQVETQAETIVELSQIAPYEPEVPEAPYLDHLVIPGQNTEFELHDSRLTELDTPLTSSEIQTIWDSVMNSNSQTL